MLSALVHAASNAEGRPFTFHTATVRSRTHACVPAVRTRRGCARRNARAEGAEGVRVAVVWSGGGCVFVFAWAAAWAGGGGGAGGGAGGGEGGGGVYGCGSACWCSVMKSCSKFRVSYIFGCAGNPAIRFGGGERGGGLSVECCTYKHASPPVTATIPGGVVRPPPRLGAWGNEWRGGPRHLERRPGLKVYGRRSFTGRSRHSLGSTSRSMWVSRRGAGEKGGGCRVLSARRALCLASSA